MDSKIYLPNKTILDQPDHVLEIWYGKASYKIIESLRLIDPNEVSVNSTLNIVFYYNSKESIILNNIMSYDFDFKCFTVSYILYQIIKGNFKLNHDQINSLFMNVLNQLFPNLEVKSIKWY
jgi:hypothetical protein